MPRRKKVQTPNQVRKEKPITEADLMRVLPNLTEQQLLRFGLKIVPPAQKPVELLGFRALSDSDDDRILIQVIQLSHGTLLALDYEDGRRGSVVLGADDSLRVSFAMAKGAILTAGKNRG